MITKSRTFPKSQSVRRSLFLHSLLFSLIIMAAVSLFLSYALYQFYSSKAAAVVKQRNYAVNYYIDGYFAEINNIIEVLSTNMFVRHYTRLGPLTRRHVLDLYDTYLDTNSNITYIYSGYSTGELAINDYPVPEGFDSRTRPWYRAAMESGPGLATGIPYRDINSGEWLLATSKALPDGEGGYSGVVSCDSSIEKVTHILNSQRDGIYESSYSFVLSPDGEVLLHYDRSLIKRNISDIIGDALDLDAPEGLFSYTLEDKGKLAYFSRCEEADWLVVTVVDEAEVHRPIVKSIVHGVSLTGLIAVLAGLIQSYFLSRQFSIPIQELHKQVNNVINGREGDSPPFDYPRNEIGFMAGEVGKLAVNELYRKSHELERVNALLLEKNRELLDVSFSDQLTGLYNRRKIDEEMERCRQIYLRYGRPFSLILVDLDYFKAVNDEYGHLAGDRVLRETADLLRDHLRPCDIISRWGGEEFLILCTDTNAGEAAALAERLCRLVGEHPFSVEKRITLSGGVSAYEEGESLDDTLKRADENLYRAKGEGRNRIVSP